MRSGAARSGPSVQAPSSERNQSSALRGGRADLPGDSSHSMGTAPELGWHRTAPDLGSC